ncbi:MAG TPA: 5-deoxy-glucuronate isomerase [Acidobacteriaceae bacterium]
MSLAAFNDPVPREGNIFRRTNTHKGRKVFITPQNSTMKHLCYARTLLDKDKLDKDKSTPAVEFDNDDHETALICLSGDVTVKVGNQSFALAERDSMYIPRESNIQMSTQSAADVAEFSAEVEGKYPLQVVYYADIKNDNSLHFVAGGAATTRDLNILLGKNVQAGRLVAGLTISDPGNWTSWPPHEHAAMLEEMYVYIYMPAPAFGIQFVYTNTNEPELATIVRDGDAVLMPRGYHPNVAAPGYRIGFLWAMAAHREKQDRQFGVVNVQPEFSRSGSGLEASRK